MESFEYWYGFFSAMFADGDLNIEERHIDRKKGLTRGSNSEQEYANAHRIFHDIVSGNPGEDWPQIIKKDFQSRFGTKIDSKRSGDLLLGFEHCATLLKTNVQTRILLKQMRDFFQSSTLSTLEPSTKEVQGIRHDFKATPVTGNGSIDVRKIPSLTDLASPRMSQIATTSLFPSVPAFTKIENPSPQAIVGLADFLAHSEPYFRSCFHEDALEGGESGVASFKKWFMTTAKSLVERWEGEDNKPWPPNSPATPVLTSRRGRVSFLPATDSTKFVVVGDLHGCYGNLRSILWQSDIVTDLLAKKDSYLIFLGDYIDRGAAEFPGVIPLALELALNFPDRVVLLQGNHELFARRADGTILPTCRPSDTFDYWRGEVYGTNDILGGDFWDMLVKLFDAMPLLAISGNGLAFSHAGLPSEEALAAATSWRDLGGANLAPPARLDCVHSILWLDPFEVDPLPSVPTMHGTYGPRALERFFATANTKRLIRGHVAVPEGVEASLGGRVLTVHSAGGRPVEGMANPHDPAGNYSTCDARYLTIQGERILASLIHWEKVVATIREEPSKIWM